MNAVNYQRELDKLLSDETMRGKRLFLHSCCAPCSSYVLTYLSSFFDITVFYFNPNITCDSEYRHRVDEQKRLIEALNSERNWPSWATPLRYPISVMEGEYDSAVFFEAVRGLEKEPEGGARCAVCFRLRLEETARRAVEGGFDYFGTTLTISPLKNAQVINGIGKTLEQKYGGVCWLPSDFKKKEGYKHSIELSHKYELYRQNFCGCEFSKQISQNK